VRKYVMRAFKFNRKDCFLTQNSFAVEEFANFLSFANFYFPQIAI